MENDLVLDGPISYMFMIFLLSCLHGWPQQMQINCCGHICFFWQQSLLACTFECATFPDFNGNKRFGRCVFLLSRCQKPICWDLTNSFFGGESEVDTILRHPDNALFQRKALAACVGTYVDLNERYTAGVRRWIDFATYIGYKGLLVSCFDHTAP